MYERINCKRDTCTNSKLVSDTILSLPIHAWLTDNEISTIIDTVRNTLCQKNIANKMHNFIKEQ